jgi:hypothetical protein
MLKEFFGWVLAQTKPEIQQGSDGESFIVLHRDAQAINTKSLAQQFENNIEFLDSLRAFSQRVSHFAVKNPDLDLGVKVEVGSTVKAEALVLNRSNYQNPPLIARVTSTFKAFQFDKFIEQEQFLISLQTLFVKDENLLRVFNYLSSVKKAGSVEVDDDSFSQEVVVKREVLRNGKIENPVVLRPLRAFAGEIVQPDGKFTLRVKGNEGDVEMALFECDGGFWRKTLADNILLNLKENIKEKNVLILGGL